MATDPRIPDALDPKGPGHTGGLRPQKPSGGRTGVVLAIVVALLLLGAILYFMPQTPKVTAPSTAADVPQQPTGEQVQLQDMQMSMAPAGGSMYIHAMLNNNGQSTIDGLAAQVKFRAEDGTIVGAEEAKVMGLKQQGQTFTEEDLTQNPIKPNDSRPVRIAVDRVPDKWNRSMPEIAITTVTAHQ